MKKRVPLAAIPLVAAGIAIPFVGASAAPQTPRLTGGIEHVYVGSAGVGIKAANQPSSTIILTGAFADYGHTGGNGSGKTVLQKGTITVSLAKVKPTVQAFNVAECSFKFSAAGPIKILRGTGAYKGITGSFKFSETGIGIGVRLASGACNTANNAPSIASVFSGSGTGTVKF
jgi:hypothetical protein